MNTPVIATYGHGTENDFVIIDSGLESGEVVNLSPIQTVVDGMRVSLTFEPTADRG